jgi:hypothetical protein
MRLGIESNFSGQICKNIIEVSQNEKEIDDLKYLDKNKVQKCIQNVPKEIRWYRGCISDKNNYNYSQQENTDTNQDKPKSNRQKLEECIKEVELKYIFYKDAERECYKKYPINDNSGNEKENKEDETNNTFDSTST